MNVLDTIGLVIGVDVEGFKRGMREVEGELQKTSAKFKQVGQDLTQVGKTLTTRVTLPLAAVGAASVKLGADFERSMNMVSAVTGSVGEDFASLRDLAKELGSSTQFSASEAADAMYFLASAGFDTQQIMGTLPGVLQLAASAQMDLATAADITSNILSGYGMEVSELGKVNDVLVRTFQLSNTNLQQLGEAFKYAGPLATAAGLRFEEAAAVLGMMGNAGIQASMAGTSLRGALNALLNPTNKVQEVIEALGLEVRDSTGRIRPMVEIIRQLEERGATAEQMMQLFGQRAGPAMQAVVSQGSRALEELVKNLDQAGGTAKRVADVQMQGVTGAFLAMRSALEGAAIAIFESGLGDLVKDIADQITEMTQAFIDLDPETQKFILVVGGLAAVIGPSLIVIGSLVSAIGTIATAMTTVAALFAAPAAAVVAAIAGIGAAFGAAYVYVEKFRNIVNSVLEKIGLGGLAGFLNAAADRFKTFDNQVKTSNVTMELFGRQLGVVSTGVTTAEDNVALFGRQLGIVSDEAETTGEALEDFGAAAETAMSNAAAATVTVSDRIAELAQRYGLTEANIRNTPLAIPIRPGEGPNDLSALLDEMFREYANGAKAMKDNADIPEAMRENIRESNLFRITLQDVATAARPAADRIANALEDISPALRPAAEGLRAFIDDLSQGESFANALQTAIGAVQTSGLSLLIDTAIGVLSEMFSKDSEAKREAEKLRDAIQSNEKAIRENTESQLRVVTGGIGGEQLSAILTALEASYGGRGFNIFDPRFADLVGRPFNNAGEMFIALIERMGLDYADVTHLMERLDLSTEAGAEGMMQLMRLLQNLIGGQLTNFANALSSLQEQFRFLGTPIQSQISQLIGVLTQRTGTELDRRLTRVLNAPFLDQAGREIASIAEGLRTGNRALLGALGDIPIDDFIGALDFLFGLIQQREAELTSTSSLMMDEGIPLNMLFDPVLMDVGEAAIEERDATELALEQDRIAYDAMINRLEMLDSRLNTLIGTNRTGFEDVAGAVLRR